MKFKNSLFVIFVLKTVLCFSQESTIELPINVKNGFGPFGFGMGGISPYSEDKNNPWYKTHLKISGIPGNWTDVKQGDIETNIYQTVYQNFLSGNIAKEQYESLQKSWNWIPDTTSLTGIPVKSKIAFAFGKDNTGKTQMVVDVNNNLDLSDDPIFTPFAIENDDNVKWDSLITKNTIIVSYERFSGGKIIREEVPLFIAHMKKINMFMCCFPQYATAQLDGAEIVICSNHFTSLSYQQSSLALMDDSLRNGEKLNNENLISTGEYLLVNGHIYKNKGVNLNKNVLVLEKINLPQNQLYSTQVGFKSFAFEGQNYTSKASISLNDYKGKYVLLDFWAVWCGPCRQELPNLKALYDKIDKSKIEIVGIVGDSPADGLEKMMEQYSITWSQILSDEKNKIKETYGVSGYPTTFLINPDGIIVGKNLRGKDLENKINEMIGK